MDKIFIGLMVIAILIATLAVGVMIEEWRIEGFCTKYQVVKMSDGWYSCEKLVRN